MTSIPALERLLADLEGQWRIYGDEILDRHDDFVCECAEPEDAALICEAVNALPALIAAVKALQQIAESYPWESYDENETIRQPHEQITHAWYETDQPTNRRVAREALAPFSFEEQTP